MQVRWRGLELPARVEKDPKSATDTFGRFTAEPFVRGFGTTVGNSLRRILLSSIEGAAVTKVSIQGVSHPFETMDGVLQDVTDILLNMKNLVVSMQGDGPMEMKLSAEGLGDITAELMECDPSITIHNPELVIATLTAARDFEATLTVERGRGYRPASEYYETNEDQVIGEIPIDAIFSPVTRVRFRTESARVGQRTDYDKLVLDIWTNGTIAPEMAMVEGAKILRKHLNPFVMYDEAGEEVVSSEVMKTTEEDMETYRKLQQSMADLDLSVRSSNCLESAQIRTVAELVQKSEDELLSLRAFGRTSLHEIEKKLEELGLALGMPVPEAFRIG
ncbi:MAG: DNA-directed RNA polymerase subunit alpha [Planctomycetaceae bacterium]|nr:DNA-directed RNA polymerase subunit alpha [Planctomycetaceae bacterium]